MLEILLLSATQGITEFLPVSSTAHLILLSEILNYKNENLTIDISLHLGSLIAVILFFKKEIMPTLLFGFLMVKLNLIEFFRNPYIISLTTIFFGVLLYFADRSVIKKNNLNDFSIKDSIYIGLMQCLSLIPGVSRSGITITGARFLNFNRSDSAKIAFLFSIPTLLAVSFYGVTKLIEIKNFIITVDNFWAIFFSFVFSLITLKFFIKYLKKFSLFIFVIYRIVLGLLIFAYVY
jgi:undecaprenyl-diphosphatase